ncbi:hypothetical protein CYJ46_09810 [Corynebacterium coyleae]|nr:hypothetical protein CYJ46_09810 [Corynebacterium coyleae]
MRRRRARRRLLHRLLPWCHRRHTRRRRGTRLKRRLRRRPSRHQGRCQRDRATRRVGDRRGVAQRILVLQKVVDLLLPVHRATVERTGALEPNQLMVILARDIVRPRDHTHQAAARDVHRPTGVTWHRHLRRVEVRGVFNRADELAARRGIRAPMGGVPAEADRVGAADLLHRHDRPAIRVAADADVFEPVDHRPVVGGRLRRVRPRGEDQSCGLVDLFAGAICKVDQRALGEVLLVLYHAVGGGVTAAVLDVVEAKRASSEAVRA